MATDSLPLLLFFLSLLAPTSVQPKPVITSPYLPPEAVFFPDYQKMISTLRIYIYGGPPNPPTFTTPAESLFYTCLLNSSFVTQNPNEAHLFFLPFSSHLSTRSLSRLVRDLRVNFPFWNRTLGADHFYLSRAGIGFPSDRNVLELKKNSVQISAFPTVSGNFVPHKDITLPPLKPSNPSPLELPHAPVNKTVAFLGLLKLDERFQSGLVEELDGDPDFLIESEPSDLGEKLGRSKFCLFSYGGGASWLGEALRFGCVPVVIADRPIQDLPLMDVLRWSEIAVFVGTGGGAGGLKAATSGIGGDRYERMRGLGVRAGQHLLWNSSPQPLDAFYSVMYQLWLRRHTIRYSRREFVE